MPGAGVVHYPASRRRQRLRLLAAGAAAAGRHHPAIGSSNCLHTARVRKYIPSISVHAFIFIYIYIVVEVFGNTYHQEQSFYVRE